MRIKFSVHTAVRSLHRLGKCPLHHADHRSPFARLNLHRMLPDPGIRSEDELRLQLRNVSFEPLRGVTVRIVDQDVRTVVFLETLPLLALYESGPQFLKSFSEREAHACSRSTMCISKSILYLGPRRLARVACWQTHPRTVLSTAKNGSRPGLPRRSTVICCRNTRISASIAARPEQIDHNPQN